MQKIHQATVPPLADRIKSARNAVHISQARLAKALGLSDKSISAYEKGRSIPPLETLQQIAKETKKTLTYFTDDTIQDEAQILEKLHKIEEELQEVKKILTTHKRNS